MSDRQVDLIDVWDVTTFDLELVAVLSAAADIVHGYMTRDHEIFLSHDLGRGPERSILRPDNAYAGGLMALKEQINELMKARTIRAWHYTRLTDAEVRRLYATGVELSTPMSLEARLRERVAAGELSVETADALYAASPFQSDQLASRANKFWMTSHPIDIADSGVKPLMAQWGGEVASFWMKDPDHRLILAGIGRRRVIEVAVPLEVTAHAFPAAEAVIATFGRSLGCIPSKSAFDLYASAPLPGEAILAVHSDSETPFSQMARGYPLNFIDVDLGRWKELTGEDD